MPEPIEMTISDCEEVLDFWREMPGVGLSEGDTPEGLAVYLLRNPGLSWIVREEGRIVAAVLCGHEGRRGYLNHLAVSPEHRNQGLGKALVERCLAKLGSLGIPKCNLFVYADNDHGSDFWKRNGWHHRSDLKVMQRLVPLREPSVENLAEPSPSKTLATAWKPGLYEEKHSFVWKLGSSLVELLAPAAGERILDLGSGTGQLTAQIAASGAEVIGLDQSPAMVTEARRQHPPLRFDLGEAEDFEYPEPFDAVFSNAVLHWIKEPLKAVRCIEQALKPGGRIVAEFGGKGNVRHLAEAAETVSLSLLGRGISHPWYFPSISEFSRLLESAGLEVRQAVLFDRPTPLEGDGGVRDWFRMFGDHWLSQIPEQRHEEFFIQVEDLSRPHLFQNQQWHADYRRLRIVAYKRVKLSNG
jgi:trans-aconitate methyltransferase/GNAT superfamily N-acetyltransferase